MSQVSVVVPTRDRWELVERAVWSIRAQHDVAYEVIVVDDHSASSPPPALRRAERDLRIVRHDQHSGLAAARNTGIHEARGEWIAFLDDDDLWAPTKLARVLAAAAQEDAGLAYSAALVVDEALQVIGFEPAPTPLDLQRDLIGRCVISGSASSAIVRRDLLVELGGFDESFTRHEDWDMWIRLAGLTRAAAAPEPLVAYQHHPGAMSVPAGTGVDHDFEKLIAKHRELARALGTEVDVHDYERYLANRAFRAGARRAAARRYFAVARRHHDAGSALRGVGALVAPTRATRAQPVAAEPEWLTAARDWQRSRSRTP